jgi:vanadium nitrogenase delta subunit
MSLPTADDLFAYIQQRCLWQFHSREWDRTENIEGILGKTTALLTGEQPKPETAMERVFLADAKELTAQLRAHFPDIAQLSNDEIERLIAAVKQRVTTLAITESKNHELTQKAY